MIYIATNKDNKDALMHYGVKGMRWGKRGGMSKNPEDYSDTQSTRRGNPKDKYDGRYGLGHQRIAVARQRVGNEWTYKQVSPGKISRKNNISTGARPQQNKISTSLNARSVPDKRYKQYLRDKAERKKVDERKERYQQEQQRRADREEARKRQQDLKNKRFETKKFHTKLTGNSYFGKYVSVKDPGADMWEREHAGEKNPFDYNWRKDLGYKHKGRKIRRR